MSTPPESPQEEHATAPARAASRAWYALAALAMACAVIGLAAGYVAWWARQPLAIGSETEFTLPGGASLKSFVNDLHERGVVNRPLAALAYANAHGLSRSLKAGEYRISPGMNWDEVLRMVVSGRGVAHAFLVVDGWTFAQARAALRNARGVQHTLEGLSDAEVMARLGLPGAHPEGQLLPETYHYQSGTTDLELLRIAHAALADLLAREWQERDESIPLKSPEEALVLASIVEKETGRSDERPLIAGVFMNRLRRGMKLQTDPTVIYGLGPGFDGNLRTRDLHTDTPYNTYTRNGLPPTPIALAGRAALHAVMHPATTSALYFVARGDGSHQFSDTLAAHNEAVARYQLNGRKPRSTQ